jgi:hypothetical protein
LDGHFVIIVPTVNDGRSSAAPRRCNHHRPGDGGAAVIEAPSSQLADALGDAAMHLALDDHGIDDDAEVVDRHRCA